MSNRVTLSPRDVSLLRLLSWTPATTDLLLRASPAFDGGPFLDERRLRERLQTLQAAGYVRSWPSALGRGGLRNYYKATPLGLQRLFGEETILPTRAFFAEVSPSLFDHTFRLAEAIVTVVRACQEKRVKIERFTRENELTLSVGNEHVQPDGFFRLKSAGRDFNLALEIDNSTESLDSNAANSLRRKLTTYHAYQASILSPALAGERKRDRPRFRVVFLTRSVERTYHLLALAAQTNAHPNRRLVYATPYDHFVTESEPLHAPLFLDHRGAWQSLVDTHPSAAFSKSPVFLGRMVESPFGG
jgi:hypothetical protein